MFASQFVFNPRFAEDVDKIKWDETKLRNDIKGAISNVIGFRSSPFIPHMAFEAIVKREIKLLETPIRVCIDSVVDLLLEAIRKCTGLVSFFFNNP